MYNNTTSMVNTTVVLWLMLISSMGIRSSYGYQYIVGDSIWSIPPTNNFYANWSSSYSFQIGDTLYFDFSSGFYDVIQVSRGGYDSCSSDQAFQAFTEGPLVFPLTQKGAFYFICNVSNYCQLGLKVTVNVAKKSTDSSPVSPSSLPSLPPVTNSPHISQAPDEM